MSLARRSLLILLALSGCASVPPAPSGLPLLRLPPTALGGARYALSQRLSVTRLDQPDAPPQRVEVQLQLDASGLLLAGFAFGQRVLLVQWDGRELQVQRHPMLPAEVDTDRMLRDLCLTFWPADAVRTALPDGWTWVETAAGQALQQGGQARLLVRRPGVNIVEIINRAEGYRLLIESQPPEAS
jgi:Protein of unknown function (DUF3261)